MPQKIIVRYNNIIITAARRKSFILVCGSFEKKGKTIGALGSTWDHSNIICKGMQNKMSIEK